MAIKCNELYNTYDINLIDGALSHCCKFETIELNVTEIKQLDYKYFSNNSETIKARTDLLQDIKTSRCKDCWELEAAGKISWRQHRGLSEDSSTDIIKLNLQTSSLCNQTCYYCTQTLSSSIARYGSWVSHTTGEIFSWGKEKIDPIINFDHVIQFVESIPESVKMLEFGLTGGEPFIVDNFNENIKTILQTFCSKDKDRSVQMTISTNTNVDVSNLLHFYEIIKELKTKYRLKVLITTSVENIEERAEYVRGGLVWSNFINNFNIHNASADLHSIRMTINPFSIVNITDFFKFFMPYNVNFNYNYPHQKFFRTEVLDNRFLPELIKLEDYIKGSSSEHRFINHNWYTHLKSNLNDDKINARTFRKAITNIDSIKNTNWRTFFPEYIEWFDNATD
jgi:organic radical activating enzyme